MSVCWRKIARTIYLSAIGILIHLSTSTSDIEPLLQSCCKLGTTWGNNIPNCGNYPTPIPQIPNNQQSVCLSVIEICCTQVHRHRMCKRGKETAQSGQECSVLPTFEGVTHKDCCDGCKVGLIVAGMNMPCLLSNFAFQSPWHEAYSDCCNLNYISQGGDSDDRCETNNPCSQKCIDTGIVIQCSCYPGFVLASDQRTCEDINECILGTHTCNILTEICHNTIGGFQCFRNGEESQLLDDDCQLGYYKNLQTGECNDLDECTLGTHSCIHETEVCLNTPGSYTCSQSIGFQCQPGFKPGNTTGDCVDVDECAEGLDNCLPNIEVCLNNHGSYQCQDRSSQDCPAGFKWNTDLEACEDVDECEENLHACSPEEGQCHNTAGGYECRKQCSPGLIYNTFLHSCVDIDECTLGIHTCESKETCINTIGSFYCQSLTPSVCPPGFKPVPAVPGGIDTCLDVDECEENLHSCDLTTQLCVNDHGSYHCDPKVPVPSCETGFVYDDDKQECVDINECDTGDHICTPGLHECLNTEGSYRCIVKCDEGFLPSPEGVCKDINECAEGTDFCSSQGLQCINTPGSYQCKATSPPEYECPPGYKYSHLFQNCTDINECAEKIDDCDLQTERCVNFIGGFHCAPKVKKCPHGFKRNEITNQCVDVDECQEGTDECIKEKEYCVNNIGSYQCQSKVIPPLRQCKSGFRLDHFTGECQDINECLEDSHGCLSNQRCINTVGNYRCEKIVTFLPFNVTTFVPPTLSTVDPRCETGLHYDIRYQSCIDINECLEGSHKCSSDQTCVNTWKGYRCEQITTTSQPRITTSTSTTVVTEEKSQDIECSSGFHYSSRYRSCIDIDECVEQSPCEEEEDCQNEVGSYSCVCKIGFERNSPTEPCRDVNECPLGLHNCRSGQRCENTLGSYVCIRIQSCGTGYTLDSTTGKCEDDDECELGTHNCERGYTCRNLEGSFRCQRTTCPRGQRLLSDGTCTIPSCGVGMEVDSAGYCVDINECQQNPDICETYQRCRNSIGSYYCEDKIRCGNGFEPNQYGTACNDINECEKGTHDCRPNQICQNRRGGYSCECPKGYQQNIRRECEDINECVQYRNQVCAQNSDCENTPGSFNCHCKPGFRQSSDGRNCEDIDECRDTPGICQQNCRNTWGSYFCSCNVGYRLQPDNRACQDIDECEEWKGRGNLCIGFCVNEPGSYSCSCPSGYRLQADERTCEDVDECREENVCSGSDKVCINTRGDYRCHTINCPTNYERDTQHRSYQEENTIVCRKRCRSVDSDCIFNNTQSISHQFITLPATFSTFRKPIIVTTMRAITLSSQTFDTEYQILSGNDDNYFDILRGQGVGSLRLIRAIRGPLYLILKIQLLVHLQSSFGAARTTTQHLGFIHIFVSEYEF